LAEKREVGEKEVKAVAPRSNTRSNIEVAKLPAFNGDTNKVLGFLMACKSYIMMRIRDTLVKKQIQ